LFKPGHDQKARADLERRVGGLLNLVRLIDAAEKFSNGAISAEEFGTTTRVLFRGKAR
jgi:hypothetical protein